MKRIIFIPQYPANMRYQEWWYWKFPQEFEKRGFEVLTIGKNIEGEKTSEMFSPINAAIEYETEQINEYMKLELREDDILFLSDLSFPGLFCNTLYHKRCSKMYAFCHATSINKKDYFEDVKDSKFKTECANASLFDTIFVGSYYHRQKLIDAAPQFRKNVRVTYLPYSPIKSYLLLSKDNDIMSASRPTPQKVDLELEGYVTNNGFDIYRPISKTWNEYYKNLASSKVLLITAIEDTFGYQIVDAIANRCVPIARNDLAYPELLPKEYLYNSKEEMMTLIHKVLDGSLGVPELKCKYFMDAFYNHICNVMSGYDEW